MRLPADPRRRQLALLGGVTALFVILAAAALTISSLDRAPQFASRPLFPELTSQANTVGEIAIEDKSGGFHVRKTGGVWKIAERNSFPADISVVRAAIVGLAGMQIVQPRTANKENYAALGVTPPDTGGDSVRVRLHDETGKNLLADILIGKSAGAVDSEGRSSHYVRKPDEAQAFLATGFFLPKPALADWLDKNILHITRDRIRMARLTPPSGPGYTVSREKNTDENFTLAGLSAGSELSYPGAGNTIAYAVTDFPFEDIRPQADVDFSRASILFAETFDGLTIEVRTADKDGAPYATLLAGAVKPEARKEADFINARAGNWAFKLPGYRAELLRTSRDTLLKK